MVSFPQAIANGFKGYVDFTGRASRSEFWFWFLFTAIVSFILRIPSFSFRTYEYNGYTQINDTHYLVPQDGPIAIGANILYVIFLLGILLPYTAIAIRRLRDAGKHWAWIFLYFGAAVLEIIGVVIFVTTVVVNENGLQAGNAIAAGSALASLGLFALLGLIAIGLDIWYLVLLCLPPKYSLGNYNQPYASTSGYPSYPGYSAGPSYPAQSRPMTRRDILYPVTPDLTPEPKPGSSAAAPEDNSNGWTLPKS